MAEREPTTRQIRIDFPVPVHVSRAAFKAISDGVDLVCRDYEAGHPDKVMWLFGVGSLMLTNLWTHTDDEPLKFDDAVEHLEVSCREGYPEELERRSVQIARETRPELVRRGPQLYRFVRQLLGAIDDGLLTIAPTTTPADAAALEHLLGRARDMVADLQKKEAPHG